MEPIKKVFSNGKVTYKLPNGKLHRKDGPAFIRSNGSEVWYLNGKRHREDGPAAIWIDGTEEWYLNGRLHREDGPAIIRPDGYQAWYLNGIEYSQEEWEKKVT